MKISEKQKRFCNEYLIDYNGTQAAIRSGYSPKTANEQAARLLANVSIQEFIKIKNNRIYSKLEITQEKVMQELANVGFFDIRKIYTVDNALKPIRELDDQSAAAIAGIEVYEEFEGRGDDRLHVGNTVKIKLHNKIEALKGINTMNGWNAPEKRAATDSAGNDIPQLPTFQLNQLVINADLVIREQED